MISKNRPCITFAHILDQGSSRAFDLNGDAAVDQLDVDTLVRDILSTRYGDTDLDGNVDIADFLSLASHFGTEESSWSEGDFDGDGKVTFHDFLQLANQFGFGNPQLLATAPRSAGSPTRGESSASKPEPGAMKI